MPEDEAWDNKVELKNWNYHWLIRVGLEKVGKKMMKGWRWILALSKQNDFVKITSQLTGNLVGIDWKFVEDWINIQVHNAIYNTESSINIETSQPSLIMSNNPLEHRQSWTSAVNSLTLHNEKALLTSFPHQLFRHQNLICSPEKAKSSVKFRVQFASHFAANSFGISAATFSSAIFSLSSCFPAFR